MKIKILTFRQASLLLIFITFFVPTVLFGQSYPPSCVITSPFSNAYYQQTSDISINVYSTDLGKTDKTKEGVVEKIEVFVNGEKIGESAQHKNNTFTIIWQHVADGEYIITAKATNSAGVSFTSAGVFVTVGKKSIMPYGMSSCKGKYVGNIVQSSWSGTPVGSNYNAYWNAVTAENGCKWKSVEKGRDTMTWTDADIAYNHAAEHNMLFRYHTIAWGSQYPKWIEEIADNEKEFKEEILEYMQAIKSRYTYIDQIDVLNENLQFGDGKEHAHDQGTPYFRKGMGGSGDTGYDWAVWLFKQAREIFPNSKLILNDFGLENDPDAIDQMLNLVRVLRDYGLIDGFGTQAHRFNIDQLHDKPDTLQKRLSLMAQGGVPIYVTELDMRGTNGEDNEASQLISYKNLFPVYYAHPDVAGISIWGYVEGTTWFKGTGLINKDGTERQAMTWLNEYISGLQDIGYPFCSQGNE